MSPPSFTEFETLEVAIKERCRVLAGGLCETQRSRESFRTRRSAASSGSTCQTLRDHRAQEAPGSTFSAWLGSHQSSGIREWPCIDPYSDDSKRHPMLSSAHKSPSSNASNPSALFLVHKAENRLNEAGKRYLVYVQMVKHRLNASLVVKRGGGWRLIPWI